MFSFQLLAQSYVGNNNLGICLIQERKDAFVTWGFKTVIQKKSEFKFRVGFEYRENRFSGIIYLPMLNVSLSETRTKDNLYLTLQYNTPLSGEIRYYHDVFAVFAGIELYTDKPKLYFNLLIPFNY